jgi:hypothetical protein
VVFGIEVMQKEVILPSVITFANNDRSLAHKGTNGANLVEATVTERCGSGPSAGSYRLSR